jgi:PhoH-like ATPase
VLEELDHLKRERDERGRNARETIRFLDKISQHGNLQEGVKLENGSLLRVSLGDEADTPVPPGLQQYKTDNKIIHTAYALQKTGKQVFFVSKDINARLKATALGVKAVDYEKQKVNINTLYKGFIEIDASSETLQELRETGRLPWNTQLIPHEFVLLKKAKSKDRALCRYEEERQTLRLVETVNNVYGLKPLNIQQAMALDLLLDEQVTLVTLVGKAGTGKTLLALASGLKQVLEKDRYSRVLISRPLVPMGKDIGYLPGGKSEKLSHWMQPVNDNLEYLLNMQKEQISVDQLIESKAIELEALTYIRGRSLPDQFVIIDEAQNLSPHEVKTIVSRAGEGTKVVLTGDPFQIDSPYLDANSNGLTYLVEAFKGQRIFGHILLEHSERSKLAELAAELL